MAKPGQARKSKIVYPEGSEDPSMPSYTTTDGSRGSISPSAKKPVVHQKPNEKVYDSSRKDSKYFEDRYR
ncbi:hypothetical protein LTR85_002858 [Meristemomyces frigidus]|nr:hypothetical protein LTR85_002858 [Meristemomyces frigidus]